MTRVGTRAGAAAGTPIESVGSLAGTWTGALVFGAGEQPYTFVIEPTGRAVLQGRMVTQNGTVSMQDGEGLGARHHDDADRRVVPQHRDKGAIRRNQRRTRAPPRAPLPTDKDRLCRLRCSNNVSVRRDLVERRVIELLQDEPYSPDAAQRLMQKVNHRLHPQGQMVVINGPFVPMRCDRRR